MKRESDKSFTWCSTKQGLFENLLLWWQNVQQVLLGLEEGMQREMHAV